MWIPQVFAVAGVDVLNARCLLLPKPLVALLFARPAWSSLVVLGRSFYTQGHQRHAYSTCPLIFPDWPPKDWLQHVQVGLMQPKAQEVAELSPEGLDEVAESLRIWRGPLLETASDPELDGVLRRHVLWLSSCARQLKGQRGEVTPGSGHRSMHHSAARLLASFQVDTSF